MSIRWDLIKPLLEDIIGDLTGANAKVRWEDEPKMATWGDVPMVTLRVTPTVAQGQEEEFTGTVVTETENLSTVVAGQRQFTLGVKVESFEQDIKSDKFAANVMEKLRIGLKRSTTQARYQGIFAIENRLAINWTDYVDNSGRQVSCYIMDLAMRTVNNDVDESISAGGFISEVGVRSDVLHDVDSQINLDIKAG